MLLYCGDQTELVENEDSDSSQLDEDDSTGQYEYLLGMTMWTLTKERKEELLQKRDDKLAELKILQSKTHSALWKEDLNAFLQEVCCEKTIQWLHVGVCHVRATGSLFCYHNLLSLSAAILLCVQPVRSVDDVNVIYKLMVIGSRYLSHVMTVLGSICVHRKYWKGLMVVMVVHIVVVFCMSLV
jgi:hypothetical protein